MCTPDGTATSADLRSSCRKGKSDVKGRHINDTVSSVNGCNLIAQDVSLIAFVLLTVLVFGELSTKASIHRIGHARNDSPFRSH